MQCYACLLTFSLAECKDFAALLFIFAKCAAPFRGKNLSLHCLGATDDRYWCDQVAHIAKTRFTLFNKAIGVPEWRDIARPDKTHCVLSGNKGDYLRR
ncbi:hypothetical protein CO700_05980 [Citrobacter koseri]|nr:hypothetical protein CO700_05980 [Citrobacter koseri]